jgi:hypothetical protein
MPAWNSLASTLSQDNNEAPLPLVNFTPFETFFFSLTTTSGVSFVWGASQLGILLFGCRGQLQDSLIS